MISDLHAVPLCWFAMTGFMLEMVRHFMSFIKETAQQQSPYCKHSDDTDLLLFLLLLVLLAGTHFGIPRLMDFE